MNWIVIDEETYNPMHFTSIGKVLENMVQPNKVEYYFKVYQANGNKPLEFMGYDKNDVVNYREKLITAITKNYPLHSKWLHTFETRIKTSKAEHIKALNKQYE